MSGQSAELPQYTLRVMEDAELSQYRRPVVTELRDAPLASCPLFWCLWESIRLPHAPPCYSRWKLFPRNTTTGCGPQLKPGTPGLGLLPPISDIPSQK